MKYKYKIVFFEKVSHIYYDLFGDMLISKSKVPPKTYGFYCTHKRNLTFLVNNLKLYSIVYKIDKFGTHTIGQQNINKKGKICITF